MPNYRCTVHFSDGGETYHTYIDADTSSIQAAERAALQAYDLDSSRQPVSAVVCDIDGVPQPFDISVETETRLYITRSEGYFGGEP